MTEYYTELEWKELYLHITTWINYKTILSERSQTQLIQFNSFMLSSNTGQTNLYIRNVY